MDVSVSSWLTYTHWRDRSRHDVQTGLLPSHYPALPLDALWSSTRDRAHSRGRAGCEEGLTANFFARQVLHATLVMFKRFLFGAAMGSGAGGGECSVKGAKAGSRGL